MLIESLKRNYDYGSAAFIAMQALAAVAMAKQGAWALAVMGWACKPYSEAPERPYCHWHRALDE